MCFKNSAWNKWLDVKLCTYLYLSKLSAFIYTSFFTLLISHINHIKYSKHFCCRKKNGEEKKSIRITCNHVCITFQHKTYNNNNNSNDIVWTIKWKSLFSIFSWWNNCTLHHFSFYYVQETFRTVSFQWRSLFNTHIWFFSVCHSVTAPRCCVDLKLLTWYSTKFFAFKRKSLTFWGNNFCFLSQTTNQVRKLILFHICASSMSVYIHSLPITSDFFFKNLGLIVL